MLSRVLISSRPGYYAPSDFLLSSAEQMRAWSFGVVEDLRLFDPASGVPFQGGLFCQKIFGPIKDYECECGLYSGHKYNGRICEACGVELASSALREKQLGHIELTTSCVHLRFIPWVASLLKLSASVVAQVSRLEAYIVTGRKEVALEDRQILSENEYFDAEEKYGKGSFEAVTGAAGLKRLLSEVDINLEIRKERELGGLEKQMANAGRSADRLLILEQLRNIGASPCWMVLDVLPIIPPALRPAFISHDRHLIASSINTDYMRLINRNRRLARLKQLNAPDIIITMETRLLQSAVNLVVKNISSSIFNLELHNDGSLADE